MSTAIAANPTGAAPIKRTASTKVRVISGPAGASEPAGPIWGLLYHDKPRRR
jgi:hypothetical protein